MNSTKLIEENDINPFDWIGWLISEEHTSNETIKIYGCAYCNNMGTFEIRSGCCGELTEYSSQTHEERCIACDKQMETEEDYMTLNCPACLNKGYIEVRQPLPKMLKLMMNGFKNHRLGNTKDE